MVIWLGYASSTIFDGPPSPTGEGFYKYQITLHSSFFETQKGKPHRVMQEICLNKLYFICRVRAYTSRTVVHFCAEFSLNYNEPIIQYFEWVVKWRIHTTYPFTFHYSLGGRDAILPYIDCANRVRFFVCDSEWHIAGRAATPHPSCYARHLPLKGKARDVEGAVPYDIQQKAPRMECFWWFD